MRDRSLGSTIRLKFTTTDSNGAPVAPSSAFAASDFRIYKDGSATEKATTNGITVTSPFDSVTGRHLIEIDTSNSTGDVGFWASGSAYFVELNTAKTVNSQSVSGLEIGSFSLELQTADVRKNGGVAITQSSGRQEVNVTHYGGTAGTFSGGRPEVNTTHWAGTAVGSANILIDGAITAAKLASDSITAAKIASDAVAEIQSGLSTLDANGVRTAVGLAAANLDTQLATIAGYIDTEVAAIKAKTDNLPTDPADASDIAAAFSTVNSTLSTIAGYIDTEIAAIKAKTDNLPSDPADQSAVEAAITAAIATVPTAAQNADAVWDEAMADHTVSTSYGGRIIRATNSNVTVQITGANHIAADVHEFQTDAIDADAIAASAVTELQAGLALQSSLTTLISYVDTEVAAIKAKTDNLPADPADASDIAASFSTVNSTLATIAAYIDTEIAAIKAKTDNLPADPADASDIAASFSSIASSIATLTAYVDTEVAAIKAKTDNLPTDPADQSAVEAAITAAASLLATAAELAKVPKVGQTHRFTQIANNSGAKTADVSISVIP